MVGVVATILVAACSGSSDPEPKETPSAHAQQPEHVGSSLCSQCHQAEAAAWQGSHHDRAMEPATDETVVGNFDESVFFYNDIKTTFFRSDGKFMVRTDGPDGQLHDFEIAYTFGIDPLQQYLIEFPDGRLQALNVCWDTRAADDGGQRWFHLYPGEAIDHADILHWTGALQNWNYMCSECHSTNVRKNYTVADDRYDTTWSEIDVSCEACHGPGSQHVGWARRIVRGEKPGVLDKGLTVLLADRDGGSWVFDPGAASAHREPPRDSRNQIETCARCHSRRTQLTDEYRHGRPLADTHRVSLLDAPLYHADGQILDEVYVYGSFLQSAMYHNGVTCTDCHDPHTARLRLTGNTTCVPCHQGSRFDTPEHHFHSTGSIGASCVACHMPVRNYMVVDPRYDHSFRIPRPDLTLTIGTPNACTDCHADRSAEWAAASVSEWYGDARMEQPHYAEALHAGRNWQPGAGPKLISTIEDPTIPGIVRATALSLVRNYPNPNVIEAVQDSLQDDDPLVRREAAETLMLFEPEVRTRLGAPALSDAVRTVRIAAARFLADVPRARLDVDQRASLERGLEEYATVQRFNEDRAAGRLNLGWFHTQKGQLDKAERVYRSAIQIEPMFSPATINLADLFRVQGRDEEGEALLRDALERVPDDADLQHALGLTLVRQKRHEEALERLERATALAPGQPRYAYVYAVAQHSVGRTTEALETLKRAHERHPGHADLVLALATVSRDNGDSETAMHYARKLLELAPGHPGALGLLGQLGADP